MIEHSVDDQLAEAAVCLDRARKLMTRHPAFVDAVTSVIEDVQGLRDDWTEAVK